MGRSNITNAEIPKLPKGVTGDGTNMTQVERCEANQAVFAKEFSQTRLNALPQNRPVEDYKEAKKKK